MHIEVARDVIAQLDREARAAHPLECCGILLGEGGYITALLPAVNVHPEPETQFEIDPQALIDAHRAARKGGPQVVGYYHSHPAGTAYPSATDRRLAASDGSIWAIISMQEICFWRAVDGGFDRLFTSEFGG